MLKLKGIDSKRQASRKAANEISQIRQKLGEAYTSFNTTSDPDLLEACIYEINALLARYDHALRRAKSNLR